MKHIIALTVITFGLVQADVVKTICFNSQDFCFSKQNLFNITYDLVRINGGVVIANHGKPALPAVPVHFIIPRNEEIVDVEAEVVSAETLPGTYFIFPNQKIHSFEESASTVEPNPAIYNSNNAFPAKISSLVSNGNLAGYNIVSFLLYPLKYLPSQRKLILNRRIAIRFRTQATSRQGIKSIRRSEKAQEYLSALVSKLIANPEDIVSCKPRLKQTPADENYSPTLIPSPEGSPVELLIITSPSLEFSFQRLADWKTRCGIMSTVRTTDFIYANYSGCDMAEQVRNFLKDAYANWGTVWVLLAGDIDLVPFRLAFEPSSHPTWTTMACDYYFSDLDGTWNHNGNSLFGEISDSCDMYPDLFVGRAPVNNQAEADAFVSKIISYERALAPDYQLKILMLATWIDRYTNCAIGKHDYIAVPFIPKRFQITELYQKGYGVAEGINRTLSLAALNSGFGIINQVDHTGIYNIGVGTSFGEILFRPDFDRLANGPRTGLMFSCGCNTAAFNLDCIGEHFINNPNGGGIGFIGSSRAAFLASGSPGLSPIEIYDQNFFEAVFKKNITSLGACLDLAKAKLSHLTPFISYYRYTHFALNLLGDPSLQIWLDQPKRLTVAYPETIPLAQVQYAVTVTESAGPGTRPVQGSRVVLWKRGEFYLSELTNGQGEVTFTLSAEKIGPFDITVTKQNYVPFEGQAVVTYANGPRLCYYQRTIDDDSIPPSQGNNNRIADAGETIELALTLKNNGDQTATSVLVSLANFSQFITISNGTLTFPDIPPAETRSSNQKAVVRVNPAAPCFSTVFRLESSFSDTFCLGICSPLLKYGGHIINDQPPGGNGNGVVEPCETVSLYPRIRNLGEGIANGVKARLEAIDPTIIIDSSGGELDIGDILPKTEFISSKAFRFYTTVEYLPEDEVRLIVNDSYNRSTVSVIRFRTISTPAGIIASPGQSNVGLKWDSVPGALGYNIYRKNSLPDSFFKVNSMNPVTSSIYEDRTGINPYSSYWYKISAIDSFMNESMKSTEVIVHTNPLYLAGWPVLTANENAFNPSSGLVIDLDGDGDRELVLGAGTRLFAWHANGTLVSGWPVETGSMITSSPAAADFNHDGKFEIICGSGSYVYILRYDGSTILRLTTDGTVSGAPAVYDLNRDLEFEIVVLTRNNKIYAWRSDGTICPGFPCVLPGYPGYTSPAIGDLDRDNYMEIVCGFVKQWEPALGGMIAYNHDGTVVPGWEQCETNGVIYLSSPLIGDIDQDTSLEVVMGFVSSPAGNQIIAYEADGSVVNGFPLRLDEGVTGLSLINLDQGGGLEIAAGTTGGFLVCDNTGRILFRKRFDGGVYSEPVSADIDGDRRFELVASSFGSYLYGFDAGFNTLAHFPIRLKDGTFSSPMICDIDQDGKIDIGCTFLDAHCYFWKLEGAYDERFIEWPYNRHDIYRTGNYHIRSSPVKIEDEVIEQNNLVTEGVLACVTNPAFHKAELSFLLTKKTSVRIEIYDLAGRRLFYNQETRLPGQHKIVLDGQSLSSGIYFCRFMMSGKNQIAKFVFIK